MIPRLFILFVVLIVALYVIVFIDVGPYEFRQNAYKIVLIAAGFVYTVGVAYEIGTRPIRIKYQNEIIASIGTT